MLWKNYLSSTLKNYVQVYQGELLHFVWGKLFTVLFTFRACIHYFTTHYSKLKFLIILFCFVSTNGDQRSSSTEDFILKVLTEILFFTVSDVLDISWNGKLTAGEKFSACTLPKSSHGFTLSHGKPSQIASRDTDTDTAGTWRLGWM